MSPAGSSRRGHDAGGCDISDYPEGGQGGHETTPIVSQSGPIDGAIEFEQFQQATRPPPSSFAEGRGDAATGGLDAAAAVHPYDRQVSLQSERSHRRANIQKRSQFP